MSSLPLFILRLLLACLALGAALVLLLGLLAFRLMVRRRPRDPAWIEALSLEKGIFSREELELPWKIERLSSPGGYELSLRSLPGRLPRLAIFHHGVRWNWMGSIKYARAFIREGWSVVLFDSRGHGDSGGPCPSFGYFEKLDLVAVADWALARFPASEAFVVHGESLGGATVLQYAPLDPRLDAAIADCPYTSAAAILGHRLREVLVPAFLRPLVVRLVDLLARSLEGFSLFAASPEAAILETDLPLLLIHGAEDRYVPTAMSVAMAESRRRLRPQALTELYLAPGALHAKSYAADPAAYEAAVFAFIEEALARKAAKGEPLASALGRCPRPTALSPSPRLG